MLDAKSLESSKRGWLRPSALSFVLHGVLLFLLVGGIYKASKIAPYKLPGTAQGVRLLTIYSPGSPKQSVSDLVAKEVEKPKAISHIPAPVVAPQPENALAPRAEKGSGSAADSGLGDGDISIAVMKHFPHPTPDLSALPHGTTGDVVLNAVIDEHGKISELTLLKGLGHPVDDQVIAIVRQWTYDPALKNGVPVPSEQELHFHYERG